MGGWLSKSAYESLFRSDVRTFRDTEGSALTLKSLKFSNITLRVTQYLGTWDLGNSNFGTGFGEVYDYWVLGPLGS